MRSVDGERLPANGRESAAPASTLESKSIALDDWNRALAERLRPTCVAREGVRTANAGHLASAGKILGSWTELHGTKAKSGTSDGKRLGAGVPEPTRDVNSIGMTCAAGGSSVQVNGATYPFDVAWVVSGVGKAKTLNGDDGAGQFVMIQALSYTDKRIVFAKVFVPSDANDDTDDTVIVSSLADYLPENRDEPVVRAVSDRDTPQFETFIFAKGATEGLSIRAPQERPLGRARFLSVGKFSVAR